jgi:N-acetylmuramoyl-L-alanine amidase
MIRGGVMVRWGGGMSIVVLAACSSGPRTERPSPASTTGTAAPIPPIPPADGPLQITVMYPPENGQLAVRDSTFVFGATGSGRATLTINGTSVPVAPNGGWLAFLPVPQDGVYRLQATKDGATATLERRVRLPAAPAARTGTRITSVTPTGALAVWEGENVTVSVTGTSGGQAFLVLPWRQRIPLVESRAVAAAANNAGDFQVSGPPATSPNVVSRYAGVFPAAALRSRDTATATPRLGELPMIAQRDTLMERCAAAAAAGQLSRAPRCNTTTEQQLQTYTANMSGAYVELIVGNDTVRAPVSANVATLSFARVGMAVDRTGRGAAREWRIRGRNTPSGPFHYFWPHGTLLTITGQRGGFYRVQLAGDLSAWVPVDDIELMPGGFVPPGGAVTGARFNPSTEYIDLRLGIPDRLPFHVEQTPTGLQLDVYGAMSQVNFFQYGKLDPLIQRAVWSQPRDSVFRVDVDLNQPVWGYDVFHDGNNALVLRIRRPPTFDVARPLRGLRILVDPGHGGHDTATTGPTGFREAHANLNISLALKPLLEAAGAHVIMTRTTNVFLELGERTKMATDSGAHILVSVHNNAFPDGVNPFVSNGTSVYYYHPHSVDMAQSLQRHLLAELGLRDIGYGRADLALVRPTWMPAVLTETSFMMVPEQEAALRNPEWLNRIARAHVRGLEEFVRRRAGLVKP